MPKAQIVVDDWKGFHNSNPKTRDRLVQGQTYRDLSTICVIPSRGVIPAKVVQNWLSLMPPMNQKFMRMFVIGMEVGEAYQSALTQILAHPELSTWKYLLTMEEDNLVPPDGLLKLYENIKEFDAIGGLYFTKGEGGQPMCYGDPRVMPKNFIPFMPNPNTVTRCNGLGMGFTLFKLSMFKDQRWEKQPFFKTVQQFEPGKGCTAFTQDLYFFNLAGAMGYRFGCDARVQIGHYDYNTNMVW